MKRFLSIALILVLVGAALVVATAAAEEPTYWSVNSACLVKSKQLDDGSVSAFKVINGESLLVGIPLDAVLGDNLFQAKDGYTIKYFNKNGNEITSSTEHIGTADRLLVYSGSTVVDEYALVSYGDADGDGAIDVIDAAIAALCLNDKLTVDDNVAVYESVKLCTVSDFVDIEAEDYQQVVNTVVNESQLQESDRGRKYPVDETINFESAIYNCDGAAKTAALTTADANFKNLLTIRYNGSTTAPADSGIYEVTATVGESEKYLVTPGTRNLGFIAIAPKAATGYKVSVDNENKKIVVGITSFYTADTTFDGYISGWYNSGYTLKMDGTTITESAQTITALSPRTVSKYTLTSANVNYANATDVLGCYLPDDYALWNDNEAAKTVSVSVDNGSESPLTFNLVIQQDRATLNTLKQNYIMQCMAYGRGNRTENPINSAGNTKYEEKVVYVEGQRRYNSTTAQKENVVRTVCCGPFSTYPSMSNALAGTGLKTVLVGNVDSIAFNSASTKAGLGNITSSSTLLYDTSDSNRRYSNYSSTDILANMTKFRKLINGVLGGMGIQVSLFGRVDSLVGKSGWCRYACVGSSIGLRYTMDYFLEFADATAEYDTHHSVKVVDVEGCTINTTPSQTSTFGNSYYHVKSMTNGEVFRVSATLKSGYKLSVTDANGNPVEYDSEMNWYYMPNSDVTVTAVPVS